MGVARIAVARSVKKNATVRPPSPTASFVLAGQTISAKTFDKFTDREGIIRSYDVLLRTNGSATVSGSGLGPYTLSGTADGDKGVIALRAKDEDGNTVATAIHVWGIESGASGVATDGSQDYSAWTLMSTDNIVLSQNTGLATSIGMSGNEIQFRGSAASADDNPDDGAQYAFQIKDPADDSIVVPKNGGIIGVEFYFKFGTNFPDAANEFFYSGLYNGGGGFFGGYRYETTGKVAAGSYTLAYSANHTNVTGNVFLVRVSAMDNASTGNALVGPSEVTAFDDAVTPAKHVVRFSSTSASDLDFTLYLLLSFAGDVDVTVYYRLMKAPSNPF